MTTCFGHVHVASFFKAGGGGADLAQSLISKKKNILINRKKIYYKKPTTKYFLSLPKSWSEAGEFDPYPKKGDS